MMVIVFPQIIKCLLLFCESNWRVGRKSSSFDKEEKNLFKKLLLL